VRLLTPVEGRGNARHVVLLSPWQRGSIGYLFCRAVAPAGNAAPAAIHSLWKGSAVWSSPAAIGSGSGRAAPA